MSIYGAINDQNLLSICQRKEQKVEKNKIMDNNLS